jgi:hypothetical protein
MLRRTSFATLCVLILVPALAGVAGAGGSVFDFRHEDGSAVPSGGFVLPGDVITAHTSFSSRISGLGGIEDGPYLAYLVPGFRYVSPGNVPARALVLGPLEIVKTEFDTVARITFTVPVVASGDYTISVCNVPCTVNGLGDITGGFLRVVQTAKEGRLTARLEDVRRDRSRLAHQLAASQEQRDLLRAARDDAERVGSQLESRVDELETRLRAADRDATAPDRLLIDDGPALAIAAAVALFALALLLGWRSRRTPASAPPVMQEARGEHEPASKTQRDESRSAPDGSPTPFEGSVGRRPGYGLRSALELGSWTISASRAVSRRSSSSRIGRTSSRVLPAGSSSSQSS